MASPGLRAQGVIRTWTGVAANDQVGRSVLLLPDLDGDGTPDIAAGSPLRSTAAGFAAGVVELRSGRTGAMLLLLQGASASERFGSALALSDVDHDGHPDLAVGSPLANGPAGPAAGRVTVFSLPSGVALRTLDGLSGGDRFGTTVAGLGDVDGDGTDDLAVGAPLHDGPGGASSGLVTIHSGATGVLLAAVTGEAAGDRLGNALAAAGDVNGNLRDDLIAGAPWHSGPAGAESGRVYLISDAGAIIAFTSGTNAGEHFGSAVAGPGDLDGSGDREVVVAAEAAPAAAGPSTGRVAAYSGAGLIPLWSTPGTQAGSLFGSALAVAGDQDGDGRSEIAVGARLYDGPSGADAGRATLLSGATGAALYAVDGQGPGWEYGFAVGGGRDLDNDGRPDALFAAPFAAGTAAQTGIIHARTLNGPPDRQVRGYFVGPQPEAAAVLDADGDGDRDLAVICSGDATLRLLWNGDHAAIGPSSGTGTFDQIPPTIVALDPSSPPLSIAGGNLDADPQAELVIGRADGRIQTVDGAGSVAAPVFSALPALVVADSRATPGPVRGLAIVGAGAGASVAVALAGTLVLPGEVRLVASPLGAATVGPPLASGGSFTAVTVADIDGSGVLDLVATNASLGSAGGIHVLLGPAFGPALGSPYFAGGVPARATVGALDADGLPNDVLSVSVTFTSGGLRVLSDYQPSGGFRALVLPPGLTAARMAVRWRRDQGSPVVAVADGPGDLFALAGWTGSGFTTRTPLPVGRGVVDLASAQLTAFDGPSPSNGEELVVVVRNDRAVRIVRQKQPALAIPIPGTGCPASAPVSLIGITGTPVIGDPGFGVALANATPSAPCWLALQLSPLPGTPPLVLPVGSCAFIWYGGDLSLLAAATSPSGSGLLPVPLPYEPALVGLEFGLLWAVLDGGPVAGGLTLSNSMVVRLGEFL